MIKNDNVTNYRTMGNVVPFYLLLLVLRFNRTNDSEKMIWTRDLIITFRKIICCQYTFCVVSLNVFKWVINRYTEVVTTHILLL